MAAQYSSLWWAGLALAGGLVALVGGGELLVNGAVRLARRLGMGPLLIGLTVVAFGTSMPELFVSLTALLQGAPDILVGNVVGSNIANIGLVLALSALLAPISVHYGRIVKELQLVLLCSLALLGMALLGTFYRAFGFCFVAILVTFTWISYRTANQQRLRAQENVPQKRAAEGSLLVVGGKIVIGLLLLAKGSDLFISGAVAIARHLGVSELVIGLTLAAVGTSLPELGASLAAIRRRQADLLVGNVVGSNLFNLLMVMGSAAVVKPYPLPSYLVWRDLPIMLAFSVFLLPAIQRWHALKRWHGGFLLLSYLVYIYGLL